MISPNHVDSSTFPLFSHLAPELRIRIWQFACSPRTISLHYTPEKDACCSPTPPPAVLQASHESRTEALKVYALSFGTLTQPAHIYFSSRLDTLYLPRHRPMGYDETLRDFRALLHPACAPVLDQLSTIAIDHVDAQIKRPWEAYNKTALLRTLPQLEEVLLVLCEPGQGVGLRAGQEFVKPARDLEDLLQTWIEFRQSVTVEEKVLEDVAAMMEGGYVKWRLPSVKIRSKGTATF